MTAVAGRATKVSAAPSQLSPGSAQASPGVSESILTSDNQVLRGRRQRRQPANKINIFDKKTSKYVEKHSFFKVVLDKRKTLEFLRF